MVNTVLGEIKTDQLGPTLPHEHVLLGLPGWKSELATKPFDRDQSLAKAIQNMQRLKAAGIDTILDPCPADYGRDVEFMADVSRGSGLQIICSAGVFSLQSLGDSLTMNQIADIYIKEITEGIGQTGIKPGVLKAKTGDPVLPDEEKNLHAIGIASHETSIPIVTHTDNARYGEKQLDVFESEGVASHRVVIGHSDCRADLSYHVSIMDRGAFLGLDRWGLEVYVPDKIRQAILIGLISIGYADSIVLAQDSISCWLGDPKLDPPLKSPLYNNWYPTHLVENIFPQLKKSGMTEQHLDKMLIDNPRRLFEEF